LRLEVEVEVVLSMKIEKMKRSTRNRRRGLQPRIRMRMRMRAIEEGFRRLVRALPHDDMPRTVAQHPLFESMPSWMHRPRERIQSEEAGEEQSGWRAMQLVGVLPKKRWWCTAPWIWTGQWVRRVRRVRRRRKLGGGGG